MRRHLPTPKESRETLLELREGILRLRPALIAFSGARPVSERGQRYQQGLFSSVNNALMSIEHLLQEDYADPPVGKPVPQMSAGEARS